MEEVVGALSTPETLVWMGVTAWVVSGAVLGVAAQSLQNVHDWLGRRTKRLPPLSLAQVFGSFLVGMVIGPLPGYLAVRTRVGRFQRLREGL